MRKIIAIALPCVAGWICTYLAIYFFQDYALGLFILLPIVMGIMSTLITTYHSSLPKGKLFTYSILSLLFYCLGIFLLAWDGAICIIMALPIGLVFNLAGVAIGYIFVSKKIGDSTTTLLAVFLAVPVFMAFEDSRKKSETLRTVTTSIEIKASPEEIWKTVIGFPRLDEPTEFIFKAGIAYPTNATINGHGVGAVRHCNFSTGSFVEPITVWDEPKLLQFSVEEQPATMKELSIYDIQPQHLHGYWVSKKGQFKLVRLKNGNTLLEGTTWYVNKIKPDFYWSLWSDYIVHKIHARVLKHIKQQAEKNYRFGQ